MKGKLLCQVQITTILAKWGVYNITSECVQVSIIQHTTVRYSSSYTGHQGPRGGVAVLILDLGARRGWVVSTTPQLLYPQERPGTHCTGGWVGPRAGLDVREKSRPHRDSISGPPGP
jgi:hypothetical protein